MKTFSVVSAILANRVLLLLFLFLGGCFHSFNVKENLSESQILEPSIQRKPTGQKSWGILPIYEDFLEGYLQGGLITPEGAALQGVTVKVINEKGTEIPEFVPGITDNFGIYKIRFSLPIRWNRVDFTGSIVCGPEWNILDPKTQFRFYFNRENGILSCSSNEVWFAVRREESLSKPASKFLPSLPEKKSGQLIPSTSQPADKKKADDFFGNFGFGP